MDGDPAAVRLTSKTVATEVALESLPPFGAISRYRCRASPSRSGKRITSVRPHDIDPENPGAGVNVLQADWELPDER